MISEYHDAFRVIYEVGWRLPIPEMLPKSRRAAKVYILGNEQSPEALFRHGLRI